MAKKKAPGIPNRPMYSRISFLYQAATYLAGTSTQNQTHPDQNTTLIEDEAVDVEMDNKDNQNDDIGTSQNGKPVPGAQNMSRRLLGQLRAITNKSLIRISPDVKRTICKHCDTLLVEGQTCSSVVENKSKGGKKPWADVLVIQCHTCGRAKRFPINAPKPKRRPLRVATQPKTAAQKMDLLPLPQEQGGP